MGLATSLRTVAKNLTAKFGDRITLRQKTPGKFQTSTNTMPVTSYEWDDVPVASTEIKFSTPDGRVQAGDRRMILSALAMLPEGFPDGSWEVDYQGKTWRVVLAEPVEVEGERVFYSLIVRGGAW